MYIVMKKALLSILTIFFIFQTVSAEKTPEVSLRLSRQEGIARIVVESDDEMVRNANTIASASGIRIDFPSAFSIKKTDSFTYESTHKDRTLTITPKDAEAAKTYKLSSPARIVIELKLKQQDPAAKSPKDPPQTQGKITPPAEQQKPAETAAAQDRSLKFRMIVIDAGHGGYDNGITSNSLKEKDVSINIAKELAALLQKKGVKVMLTRKADMAISLADRSAASGRSADLLISIHASASDRFGIITASPNDAAAEPQAKQSSLPAQKRNIEKNRAVAKVLADSIKAEYKTEVTARELPLSMLKMADSPAVMLEYPFSDKKTYDQKERDRLVNTVVKGLALSE